jgi:hypothetical protein
VLGIDPNNGNALYNRSRCYYLLHNFSDALNDVLTGQSKGATINPSYMAELVRLNQSKLIAGKKP